MFIISFITKAVGKRVEFFLPLEPGRHGALIESKPSAELRGLYIWAYNASSQETVDFLKAP